MRRRRSYANGRGEAMKVEYELDQWEWQGTTLSIDVDPEDYRGMTAEQIKGSVYRDIKADAEQNLHLVYAEDETVREILAALESDTEDDDDD